MQVTTKKDRLFIGCFPCGLSYCDTSRERDGDYVKLAFLSYKTLELDVRPGCPPDLLVRILADAATMQARRGEHFQVSTCGQTVLLGG